MKTINVSSDHLRELIAKCLGRDVCEVAENCKDDGFMATFFDGGHDEVPLYIPVVRFLSAFYGVEEDHVKLFWDAYNWRYRAEVTLDA